MELHQVRYFLAVASLLNFTRAAEQCNVTQPALTKGVQKLEQELGGQLIYRERQLTQLTDLGKEVLPMLARTLASAEAVRRRAQEFQRKEVAPLKIGLAPSICHQPDHEFDRQPCPTDDRFADEHVGGERNTRMLDHGRLATPFFGADITQTQRARRCQNHK